MSIAIISVIVTGSISLISVLLSAYSVRTNREIATLNYAGGAIQIWSGNLRSTISKHMALSSLIILSDLKEEKLNECIKTMIAAEVDMAIQLSDDAEEKNLAEILPRMRRHALNVAEGGSETDGTVSYLELRNEAVALTRNVIARRQLSIPTLIHEDD